MPEESYSSAPDDDPAATELVVIDESWVLSGHGESDAGPCIVTFTFPEGHALYHGGTIAVAYEFDDGEADTLPVVMFHVPDDCRLWSELFTGGFREFHGLPTAWKPPAAGPDRTPLDVASTALMVFEYYGCVELDGWRRLMKRDAFVRLSATAWLKDVEARSRNRGPSAPGA